MGFFIFWREIAVRILICDDEAEYLNILSAHVQEYMKNHFISCDITITTNPAEILQSTQAFDLAFLDIQMEQVDGIALAKELKQRNGNLVIFFVTNFNEYQDDAMDLRAFRFFEKPFDVNRLYAGLDKAMEYLDEAYVDIFLCTDGSYQRVLVDDIRYITRLNRKTVVVTEQGEYQTAQKLEQWCDMLPSLFFYSVHNSFLVNLHYVKKYKYSELILTDGTRIPIATRKQASFHKFWFEYLRRR